MLQSLEKMSTDLRLRLTDGLCDLLLDMLALHAPTRPRLTELLQTHPWILANAKK